MIRTDKGHRMPQGHDKGLCRVEEEQEVGVEESV